MAIKLTAAAASFTTTCFACGGGTAPGNFEDFGAAGSHDFNGFDNAIRLGHLVMEPKYSKVTQLGLDFTLTRQNCG